MSKKILGVALGCWCLLGALLVVFFLIFAVVVLTLGPGGVDNKIEETRSKLKGKNADTSYNYPKESVGEMIAGCEEEAEKNGQEIYPEIPLSKIKAFSSAYCQCTIEEMQKKYPMDAFDELITYPERIDTDPELQELKQQYDSIIDTCAYKYLDLIDG